MENTKKFTTALLATVQASGQDFEWYPTTQEIIDTVKADIQKNSQERYLSVLDCGAGDGRVLKALTDGEKYAIEKSKPLLNALDRSIFVVGTEFSEQTLLDKKVDVVFSNPPYSEFAQWAEKIILEANAPYVYLVIPSRWEDNEQIQAALEARDSKAEVIGEFDFLTADRQARAKVHIVRVSLCYSERWGRLTACKTDPFTVWFNNHFKLEILKSERSKYDLFNRQREEVQDKVNGALVAGNNLVSFLEECYQADLGRLMNNYLQLCELDPALLEELDVNVEGVRKALQQKIEGLKDLYWKELFNRLDKVTDRLTADSREKLLSHLTRHTHVDFTVSNAHAVAIWVIKNANSYYDDQLIAAVERLTERANIAAYKSNQRTFGNEDWRYGRTPEGLERYKLDYRIVLERCGGLCTATYSFERSNCGLSKRACAFLDDLCTIADNIGFSTRGLSRSENYTWDTHVKNEFLYRDSQSQLQVLFTAKAFKNGNLHIQFNQEFICKLNVEFGRLKGWLKDHAQAAEELEIEPEKAQQYFGANLQLEGSSLPLLGLDMAA